MNVKFLIEIADYLALTEPRRTSTAVRAAIHNSTISSPCDFLPGSTLSNDLRDIGCALSVSCQQLPTSQPYEGSLTLDELSRYDMSCELCFPRTRGGLSALRAFVCRRRMCLGVKPAADEVSMCSWTATGGFPACDRVASVNLFRELVSLT